ncbi:MAG: 8-oxo-dGTP diphosphatase [Spirochaetaceae bacterium]|nr:MAG: 8-oxo-dGTP diphosphatase [Spirochaetaceae bacterium]
MSFIELPDVDEDWSTLPVTDEAVLCFITVKDQILLIHKLRGLGAGKINGPGGRLEAGESYIEAAIRETEEEVGLTPHQLIPITRLHFRFLDGYNLRALVFRAYDFSGSLTPTPEAIPFWCTISEIPYDRMWEDDRHWLPRALNGEYLNTRFTFDGDRMLGKHMSIVSPESLVHDSLSCSEARASTKR